MLPSSGHGLLIPDLGSGGHLQGGMMVPTRTTLVDFTAALSGDTKHGQHFESVLQRTLHSGTLTLEVKDVQMIDACC